MAGSKSCSGVCSVALIGVLYALLASASAVPQVPLLLWSSERLSPVAPPAAGHIVSSSQLVNYLRSALGPGPHTVLLFLQDKLSKEDFTKFGGVFGNKEEGAFPNLEAALHSSTSSFVLPASEWRGSSAVLDLLQEKLGVSPLLVDPDTLSHLQLSAADRNLLLFNLPYCASIHKSCQEVLHKNDEIIGEVLRIVKAKNVPYTAIYTGLQPSHESLETSMSGQPQGRSLLQAAAVGDVQPPIMYNVSDSPCIMLWAQNLNVSFAGTASWIDLTVQTPTLDGSICNGTNSMLVLNYPSGITLSFAMSQRFFPVSARNWFTLDTVHLQSNSQAASFSGSHGIYAPAEYSFHCQSVNSFRNALLVPGEATQNASQWRLNFVDFQIQGFGLANGTNFSYASDCAGFFTAGIWMGLLTSLLMLLILAYGLHMIMQLNSMDRFDDPKGPSISVPQSE